MAIFCPISLFISVDLPTLGFPMIVANPAFFPVFSCVVISLFSAMQYYLYLFLYVIIFQDH